MTVLFVANVTKQVHTFTYRLKAREKLCEEKIPPGAQIRVGSEDFTKDEIDDIIKHHARYGMRPAAEASRIRGFVGLCYSIDKPITLDRILETFERNDVALTERAAERREETANAVAKGIEEKLGVPVKRVEVETIEDTTGTPRIAEGLEVVNDQSGTRHGAEPTFRARSGRSNRSAGGVG